MAEDAAHLDQRHLDAGEPLHLVEREIDDAVVAVRLADDDGSRTACRRKAPSPAVVASSSPGTMNAGSTPRSKR